MNNGWIKLHRKMLEWEWINDPSTSHLFVVILLLANHKKTKWRGEVINRGQVLTGRKQLAKISGLSEQQIRTSIKRLKSTSEITIKSTNKYSIFTIIKWEQYQHITNESTSSLTSNLTNNQPATNQQLTTSKKYKNVKNDKKRKPYSKSWGCPLYKDEAGIWWDITDGFGNWKEFQLGKDDVIWK